MTSDGETLRSWSGAAPALLASSQVEVPGITYPIRRRCREPMQASALGQRPCVVHRLSSWLISAASDGGHVYCSVFTRGSLACWLVSPFPLPDMRPRGGFVVQHGKGGGRPSEQVKHIPVCIPIIFRTGQVSLRANTSVPALTYPVPLGSSFQSHHVHVRVH
ncbi:hypothetical protein V8C26DRAFT_228606 [Trichoderma gracile]